MCLLDVVDASLVAVTSSNLFKNSVFFIQNSIICFGAKGCPVLKVELGCGTDWHLPPSLSGEDFKEANSREIWDEVLVTPYLGRL